jgi:multidrug efflux pump subunit AcrB
MTGRGRHPEDGGWLSRITAAFVDSKLVPLIIAASLLLGIFAIMATPSEEEPQIVVPMIDIHVSMPGATPKEVENRVVGPMEKLLWEIPGVEYVYSTAYDGSALTIVRFTVGEDSEKSILKTYAKLYQHLDWIPPGCSMPILKPHSIDDVPILVLTFHGNGSGGVDGRLLRSVAAQVNEEVRQIPGVAETSLIGGEKRAVTVELDLARLRANGLDAMDVMDALTAQNQGETIGDATQAGAAVSIRLDNFYRSLTELSHTEVARRDGRPVFLADVAKLADGVDEPKEYVFYVPGQAGAAPSGQAAQTSQIGTMEPAVSLAVAKRAGVNATKLADAVLRKVDDQKGFTIPDDVGLTVTRNYGDTAKDKVRELLEHLVLAALGVGCIVALFLGMRASLVVMVAVPVTLAVTLAVYYFFGYTLNRVTLFALIFCIGILVDDPIVDVENIVRHIALPNPEGKSFTQIIIDAVNEVRAPLVLATFTVIAAIMPMAFVGGLMGPYMRPMPVGASVAMLLSMSVAFVITPWTARRALKPEAPGHSPHTEDAGTRLYRAFMDRLIRKSAWRYGFLGLVGGLLLTACAFFPWRLVLVKMLPFDNKSEFQIIIDMPDGTALETTAQAAEEIGRKVIARSDVANCELYVGTAGPVTFNGLIRHYYLREGANTADLSVNLAPKGARALQSHDIAKAVRRDIQDIAARLGARVKVAEAPPGPPVLETLVAEIYGPTDAGRLRVARQVKEIFKKTPNIVDVDWYVNDPMPERVVRIERDKALASGVDPKRALAVVNAAYKGAVAGLLHDDDAREDVPITVRLPLAERSHDFDLVGIPVRGASGQIVSLEQIARIEETSVPSAIYHKNLQPVVYVTGDMAGSLESPVYGMAGVEEGLSRLAAKREGAWQVAGSEELVSLYTHQPDSLKDYSLKWDGEWQITYEVFRDMGLAFAVVMILIYILVVGWFGSYTTPLAIMAPIPLSLIGIIPAHALAGAFFTATSMIGFIAGAGIVVRNSIILVDFIEMRRSQGSSLEEAVVEAGAVRFRPMLLTAIAVVAGAFVILFDPIFQGLAISLMAGEVAATVFSRMVVPIMYYLDRRRAAAGPDQG